MHIEKVQQAMMNQERELRAKQNELTNSLKSLLNDEAIKRASEYDSLKRSMIRIANDLQEIKQSLGVRETNRSTSRANSTGCPQLRQRLRFHSVHWIVFLGGGVEWAPKW